MQETINQPEHYTSQELEVIEMMKLVASEEEFKGFLKLNALKYLLRFELKDNPVQDIEKARRYMEGLKNLTLDPDIFNVFRPERENDLGVSDKRFGDIFHGMLEDTFSAHPETNYDDFRLNVDEKKEYDEKRAEERRRNLQGFINPEPTTRKRPMNVVLLCKTFMDGISEHNRIMDIYPDRDVMVYPVLKANDKTLRALDELIASKEGEEFELLASKQLTSSRTNWPKMFDELYEFIQMSV
ncbi:DUF3310 domain-containing protein [Gracilimonas sp. Q87]|uniref:DUF3310 domain-containing protein n=1 Tax=Gracilimonas sp. Q87 TaxID=3384766 RepID=UPI0039840211